MFDADDDAGSGAGGGTGAGEPQGGNENDAGGSGTETGKSGGGDQGKLTSENRSLRQRLKAAEAERDKLKGATQSDIEKANERATAAETRAAGLETQLRSSSLRSAISDAKSQFGIVASAATVARLVDHDAIEWDDNGNPTDASLKDALKALAKSDPALVRQGPGDGGGGRATNGKADGGDMNALIRGAVGR